MRFKLRPMTNDSVPRPKPFSMAERLRALFKRHPKPIDVDDELRELVEKRDESDVPLSGEEKKLIGAAINFFRITADEVCIPRSDVVFVHDSDSLEKIITTFRTSGHSRLPVIHETSDNVVGFLSIKDLLIFMGTGRTQNFNLQKLMRPCAFVPDTLPIPKVLEEMRATHVQLAIVVDEYGGTAGLITLKDVLEHLVGSMRDDAQNGQPMLVPLPGSIFHVDPRMPIDDLEEHLGVYLKTPEELEGQERAYETIGGLILSMARHMPQAGEHFKVDGGISLKVLDADPRRLKKIELALPKGVRPARIAGGKTA